MTPATMPILIAVLAGLCGIGAVAALFSQRLAASSLANQRLRAVVAADSSQSLRSAAADEQRRRKLVESTLRELEEKQKNRRGSKPTLVGRIRQAGLSWSKQTYLFVCFGAGGFSLLVSLLVARQGPLSSLAFGVAGGLLLPHLYVGYRRKKRFRRFTEEFPNAVDVIVRGVKSGLPLVDCLRIIATEAQDPVRGEFKSIIEDQTLGIPLDEAVQRLADRVPLTEAGFFAIVIAIQSRTGGSLSEALGNLSKVLRERKKMRAKIKAMSSEAKASASIIGALPFCVAGAVYLTSPDYISLLFTTVLGNLTLGACAIWMTIGVLVMRKMINFDF